MKFRYFPELITSNNFDESKELNISDDSESIEFIECFKEIFVENKNNENIIDHDESIIKEEEYLNNSSILIRNDSIEITSDKSKQKIKNIDDNCSELSSITNFLLYDINNTTFNNFIIGNKDNNNNNIISQIGTIKHNNTFLGQKRKVFYVNSPTNFQTSNYCIYNKSSRTINEILEDLYTNENNGTKCLFKVKNKNKKKVKIITKRKDNSDNIRKKAKNRFFKNLKKIVNERLKMAHSKKFFSSLPQRYIINLTKKKNKIIFGLTLKELLSTNFCEKGKDYERDLKNYYHNLEVLQYLENNKNISENSNFNIFKKKTIVQIFKEYLGSKEFENDITSLKEKKNENNKYIIEYIIKANNLLNYFELN